MFANANVHPFGDKLSLSLGARYSDDHKVVNFSNLADTSPVAGDLFFVVVPEQKQVNWKVGVKLPAQPRHAVLRLGRDRQLAAGL